MPRPSRKADVIHAATELFSARGFHAVGVDTIVEEAGIAKMTLYNHFPSKDSLIVAVLKNQSSAILNWFERASLKPGLDPRGRLLVVFDSYEDWFASPSFRGCLFQRAADEFENNDHPARLETARHLRRLYERLTQLAEDAGFSQPSQMGEHLLLLIEGATAVASKTGAIIAARRAKRAAEVLIDAAISGGH